MKIDLTTKVDKSTLARLEDYLDNTETGIRWLTQLYYFPSKKVAYLQPFLEQALAGIQAHVSHYRSDDWWECAVMSVDFFGKCSPLSGQSRLCA